MRARPQACRRKQGCPGGAARTGAFGGLLLGWGDQCPHQIVGERDHDDEEEEHLGLGGEEPGGQTVWPCLFREPQQGRACPGPSLSHSFNTYYAAAKLLSCRQIRKVNLVNERGCYGDWVGAPLAGFLSEGTVGGGGAVGEACLCFMAYHSLSQVS